MLLEQSPYQNSLDNSLLSHLPSGLKYSILNNLWGFTVNKTDLLASQSKNFDAYFAYYSRQCITALHDDGRHISARTHQDIINIADQLKSGRTREDIHNLLSSNIPAPKPTNEAEMIDSSIDLTVRLLLMIEVGDLKFGFSGQTPLTYEGSLEGWIHEYFALNQQPTLDCVNVKLECLFNARNMERIAGFEIQWTDNLADHLRIVSEDDKKVTMFHHGLFLETQRENAIYPIGFIDETIRTLALLLPQSNPETRKWYRKYAGSLGLDERATCCKSLRAVDRQIEKFSFWRDRLVVLKQIFDEAKPTTLSQWWCDRRNSFQWYTFWVAIVVLFLTLLFGLVQCIEGGIQAYVALHPQ